MNKKELAQSLAESADLSRAQASIILDKVFGIIHNALKDGEDVRIVGFGTFSVATRAATEVRNPQTKQPMKIPASKVPKFKAGKALKASVNS